MEWGKSKYDLYNFNVRGLRTFLTFSDGELNGLAFSQSAETVTLDGAEVNENVFAAFHFNEAEAFGFVKPFYFASLYRHCFLLEEDAMYFGQRSSQSKSRQSLPVKITSYLRATSSGTSSQNYKVSPGLAYKYCDNLLQSSL